MKSNLPVLLLTTLQAALVLRVIRRLLIGIRNERLEPVNGGLARQACLSVLVPVLNEVDRLAPCLQGLLQQGPEVAEILVIDGGSDDGTRQVVLTYSQQDSRVRLINAAPVPATWNGKAWGLQVGLAQLAPLSQWVLMIDADVRPTAQLSASLLAHARKRNLAALSIATLQEIDGFGQGLLHPAFLSTLVYRFGRPGRIIHNVSEVQANGQCFLVERRAFEACGGLSIASDSLCEDITLARALVSAGYAFGFYEAGELVSVRMYENWRETWHNWSRSLPMRDQFSGWQTLSGWLEIVFVQALPLPILLFLALSHARPRGLVLLNTLLASLRLGILVGTARAYRERPWSYWLSPLCDLPVAYKLVASALRRRHTWRGRPLLRGGSL